MGARFSAPVRTGPGAHPASCTMGTESFPGVNSGQGMTLTPHPLLVPRSSYTSNPSVPVTYSCTSTPPIGRTACTEPQCLYSTAITPLPLLAVQSVQSHSACTVNLYLFAPYGPYSLYRASVPVQYSYNSTPPIAVRPVQSLSACTVQINLYSPHWTYACTEPQCLYSTAIPLLPLWAVRPVQSLSACTVELYLYSPYGPYGLYRASVPVQGCTLPSTFFIYA